MNNEQITDFELAVMSNQYLTADYLIQNPLDKSLKIIDVKVVQVRDVSKLALKFQDYNMMLILNVVNKSTLRKMFGIRPEKWIGQEIKLSIENVMTVDKRVVKGIRIVEAR